MEVGSPGGCQGQLWLLPQPSQSVAKYGKQPGEGMVARGIKVTLSNHPHGQAEVLSDEKENLNWVIEERAWTRERISKLDFLGRMLQSVLLSIFFPLGKNNHSPTGAIPQ